MEKAEKKERKVSPVIYFSVLISIVVLILTFLKGFSIFVWIWIILFLLFVVFSLSIILRIGFLFNIFSKVSWFLWIYLAFSLFLIINIFWPIIPTLSSGGQATIAGGIEIQEVKYMVVTGEYYDAEKGSSFVQGSKEIAAHKVSVPDLDLQALGLTAKISNPENVASVEAKLINPATGEVVKDVNGYNFTRGMFDEGSIIAGKAEFGDDEVAGDGVFTISFSGKLMEWSCDERNLEPSNYLIVVVAKTKTGEEAKYEYPLTILYSCEDYLPVFPK